MHLTWACGKKILVSDKECDEQIDIGIRMKKRAQKGYGLHVSIIVHEISNNVVCATSKGSDQPAHTRSLVRAFASRLNIL